MLVKFIAHAGIYIEEEETSLVIDAWFRDSSLDQPILESLTGVKTLDFQIPKTPEKIEAYSPDAILVSHFHAHHSPLRDIRQLVGQSEKPIALYHLFSEEKNKLIAEKLEGYEKLTIRPVPYGQSSRVGPFTITPLAHTKPEHAAWLIESASGKVLHLADAGLHKNVFSREIDPAWENFFDLCPDLVFLSAGRNSLRYQASSGRGIKENGALSPIEAARLLAKIRPRVSRVMGAQNHSIWKNRQEFIAETPANEEEFSWALEWLLPEAKFVRVRPGHTFSIRDRELDCDTFIR